MLINSLFAQHNSSINKGERPIINIDNVPYSAFEPGKVSVKLNELSISAITINPNGSINSKNELFNKLNTQFGLVSAKPLFKEIKPTEKNIQLHKAWGFNRWLVFQFNVDADIKKIIKAYLQTGLFEVVEPVYKKHLLNKKDKVDYIPNDPRLNTQWHLQNTGQQGGTPGSDVHVVQAWDIETGDTDVIVAVMDEGVQLNHPDLQQNIAYKKSYNFVNDSYSINPGNHGCHVAGTIGEVNNNGVGGSGVAGGNGSINSGVRLMSCEIFEPTGEGGNIGQAFIYAADNGACISNNSWAYDDEGVYELSTMDAIDYFIQHGGGKVMQGGLVVFAAGNSGSPKKYYPSSYEKVICVAATNNKDKKTFYSTYGNWVDIAAPGGEFGGYTDVISCNAYSDYMFDHGTSMASPHVAGVAALVASYLKGKTSASDVREIVLSTADNIDTLNPGFIGKIGSGRVNAYRALLKAKAINDNKNISPATAIHATADCNYSMQVSWTKNASSNDVLLAYSNKEPIGVLTDGKSYAIGDTIAGGGTVIYKGNASSFQYNASINDLIHSFKVWSIGAGNQYSLGSSFDTVLHATTIVSGPHALQQNFNYPPLFPTLQWRTINPDNDISWTHSIMEDTAAMGAGDHYSMAMYNFQYNTLAGAVDWLTTPMLLFNHPDSLKLSFWHSYASRNTGNSLQDSLQIMVSTNCGTTYTTLWNKGGLTLATVTDTSDNEWKPTSINDWQQTTLDLTPYKDNPKLTIAFRSVNGMENNLFLDNINLSVLYKNDLAIAAINAPSGYQCNNNINPSIALINKGTNTIQSASLSYSIDNGNMVNTNWVSSLKRDSTVAINLNNSITTAGTHTIKVFINSVNQTTDNFNQNDTLSGTFTTATNIDLPLNESFESEVFPPTGWQAINTTPNDSIVWIRNTLAASKGIASAVIQNIHQYAQWGKIEDLITPTITVNREDNVYLLFDLSYDTTRLVVKKNKYDTLQVEYTTDCGNSWQPLYLKWGATLQTNKLPATRIEYVPSSIDQWRTDTINLSGKVKEGDQFRVRFRNIENDGNDLYIDNIRLDYRKVTYPNPFDNSIFINNPANTTNLKYIELYDMLGRKVAEYSFKGNAQVMQTITSRQFASGIYILKLIYSDKIITHKMLKANK